MAQRNRLLALIRRRFTFIVYFVYYVQIHADRLSV